MRARQLLMFFWLVISVTFVNGQETSYDIQMEQLAQKTANKIKEKKKLNVAVWFFHDTRRKKTELGDYVGKDFSIHFTNVSGGFKVIDRDHIEQLSEELQWNEEGLINPQTAKQVGMITAADAIVTGTVDYGLHSLRLRIKIIDTETGEQIAATIGNVMPDENIKYILQDYFKKNEKSIDKEKKRENSEEKYGNAQNTNARCEENNIGNYCFNNSTDTNYLIDIRGNGVKQSITVGANQTFCFNDLPTGAYTSSMYENGIRVLMQDIKGNFRVEKCKIITFKIIETRTLSSYERYKKSQEKSQKKDNNVTIKNIIDLVEPILKKRQKN